MTPGFIAAMFLLPVAIIAAAFFLASRKKGDLDRRDKSSG